LLAAWLAFSTNGHLGASRLSYVADRGHGSLGHAIAVGGQMLMTAVLSAAGPIRTREGTLTAAGELAGLSEWLSVAFACWAKMVENRSAGGA
jgi:hypothetical protein